MIDQSKLDLQCLQFMSNVGLSAAIGCFGALSLFALFALISWWLS